MSDFLSGKTGGLGNASMEILHDEAKGQVIIVAHNIEGVMDFKRTYSGLSYEHGMHAASAALFGDMLSKGGDEAVVAEHLAVYLPQMLSLRIGVVSEPLIQPTKERDPSSQFTQDETDKQVFRELNMFRPVMNMTVDHMLARQAPVGTLVQAYQATDILGETQAHVNLTKEINERYRVALGKRIHSNFVGGVVAGAVGAQMNVMLNNSQVGVAAPAPLGDGLNLAFAVIAGYAAKNALQYLRAKPQDIPERGLPNTNVASTVFALLGGMIGFGGVVAVNALLNPPAEHQKAVDQPFMSGYIEKGPSALVIPKPTARKLG